MSLTFAPASTDSIPLHIVDEGSFSVWLEDQSAEVKTWATVSGFTAAAGQALALPAPDGSIQQALAGFGTKESRARRRFILAAAAQKLPKGTYHIASGLPADQAEVECLGWLLGGYIYDRYRSKSAAAALLVAPKGIDASQVEQMAKAEQLTRDLINTPAADMGPEALETAARDLAQTYDAACSVITGDALLDENLPMIHTVGRAADRAPRLIEIRKGTSGPKLTLVGKGVCFDTGGLNLKPGASMGIMKKDMGGAANVLGLTQMILAADLPVQLRVLIPAVENAVSGNAFRPGDVLTSRKGLTVEINNTDAEGRLVLADALALADEETPDLLISMATLTGAARVAVGPDLAPFYTDDDRDAGALTKAATDTADPVWRMPFHTPYETMIEPDIADLDNAPAGGFAGSITAALFLRRFAGNSRYMHFDIYAWSPKPAPGRSKGGTSQGIRALFTALPDMLDL
ncbi:leucyl aminopeptidase family protein [Epibacterium ulvae]|uniref:leucyl aminopeptidase family protein n=1 Tax=Epibacterium ulvae TaxID=1156985 RepID=UPI002492484D|nr:leucyl aminopeptidase family protein [Epibacterium ulvae]